MVKVLRLVRDEVQACSAVPRRSRASSGTLLRKGVKKMWGRHLVLDCSACDPEAVRSGEAIRKFCADLVESIGMVAYGEPLLAHFATHVPEAAGYSLVQLIETSAVTGHFCDLSGDTYLDIFSCKDFDPKVAIGVVRRHFRPEEIQQTNLLRDASPAVVA